MNLKGLRNKEEFRIMRKKLSKIFAYVLIVCLLLATPVVHAVAATSSATKAGDVNDDGEVNSLDRQMLTRHLANWEGYEAETLNMEAADVNEDGEVNSLDRQILTRHLANWEGYENLPYGTSTDSGSDNPDSGNTDDEEDDEIGWGPLF